MSTDVLIVASAVIFVIVLAAVVVWRMTSAEFVLDLVQEAADRLWNALGPKIIAKMMARMPPDEEEAWNKFKRSNPDKYEIAKWQRAYREREKKRKSEIQ
jgi:hypothetical protein